jgi:hypothetical protein
VKLLPASLSFFHLLSDLSKCLFNSNSQTKNLKMYGTERLQQTLNQKEMPLSDTLKHVHKSIKNFVKNAPQFDDVTMLALEFHHKK